MHACNLSFKPKALFLSFKGRDLILVTPGKKVQYSVNCNTNQFFNPKGTLEKGSLKKQATQFLFLANFHQLVRYLFILYAKSSKLIN
jgi:hypothetical protein